MTTKWQEKGVGVSLKKGTSRRVPVTDERDGTIGGHHIEHWDGRQDVEVIAKTTRVKARLQEN